MVIVTAQKRQERLQDVPIPVTVLDAQSLTASNQVKIADYYSEVPGLSFTPGLASAQLLSIRGLTTGQPNITTSTVGIMMDDVPFGGATSTAVPDIDPGDLQRIEVLRGPQGTLYGSSSLGGLLKFVTVDPSTDLVSGRVEAGTSSVYNGYSLGYTARGSINLPLGEDFAVRASAFTREDPGYIDNPVLHINGINEDHAGGGHLAALWKPSDTLSVKLSALYQESGGDGSNSSTALPGLSDLQQSFVKGTGVYNRVAQAYSLTLADKIGIFDLKAITGYNIYTFNETFDATAGFGGLTESLLGAAGALSPNYQKTAKLTQEIRLSSSIGSRFDWLLGLFYTHENTALSQSILATDPVSGAVAGVGSYGTYPNTLQEYATFVDLTYHFTDRFDIQVGGRESHIRQINKTETFIGPITPYEFGAPPPFIIPEERATANPFTYLFTPQFKFSPDLMVYARLASGYRAGGANTPTAGIPPEFQPDKTYDYEIGAKADFMEHTLSFDTSVYYIDWKNIQLGLLSPEGLSYTGNAGAAKSQGVELSAESRPIAGLKVAGWVTFSDAVLTASPNATVLPGTFGAPGDPLPYDSRFSGNLSVDEEFPVAAGVKGFVGSTVGYIGGRWDVFTSSSERQYLPAYAKTDLRAGVHYDIWTLNLYANNVEDRRGLLTGGRGTLYSDIYYFIPPRTIGLSVAASF